MKRYIIKETEETGSYTRGDSYLSHITIRDNLTKGTATPSPVEITIDDPCGFALVNAASMTSVGSGVYSYDYLITSTATYGKYEVSISTTTYGVTENFYFYVFPWDVEDEVRRISGVGQNKSVSDYSLNEIIWEAYKEALLQVFKPHDNVKPRQCWTACTSGYNYCINGSNCTFFTRATPIADFDGDGTVEGFGERSCGTDVDAYWKDCDGWCHQCDVIVQDANCGRLTIYQQGTTTAIPSTAKGIYITYKEEADAFSTDLFRVAVMYLAAHKLILRFGELERASSADLNSAQNIKYINPRRMWNYYRKIIKQIGFPHIGGAVTNP